MRATIVRALTNPIVRNVIGAAISDMVFTYTRAVINVTKRKINEFCDIKETEPNIVTVAYREEK